MGLRDLFVRIRGDKTSLDTALRGAEGSVKSFGATVKKLGGIIGAAFGVNAIVNFAKEAVKAASTLEGIKKGFDQIANPALLSDLRKATKGTVDDIQLMSRAVQANNFQIPLKDLAKLFEFASARAIQTGQSVDYLVDSIILGIGRKSPLILDNLGISAVKLREKLSGVGAEAATVGDIASAVGKIASEELEKMGGMAVTTSVKLQQLSASWNNLKAAAGKTLIETKAFQSVMQWLSAEAEIWGDDRLSFWEKMNGSPNDYAKWKKNQAEAQEAFIQATEKSFPGLIDGLKGVADATQAARDEEAKHAEQLRIEAEAAAIATAKMQELADVKAKLGFKGSKATVPTASVSSTPADKESVALTDFWVKGQISSTGADQLRGGPKTFLTNSDIGEMDRMNAELESEISEMESLLTAGRDMAIELGSQLVEGLGRALSGEDISDIGKDILMSVASFMSQLAKMLFATGVGMLAFNPGKGMAMIAGAAGMTLAAGIVKGSINKSYDNSVSSRSSGSSGGYSYGAYSSSVTPLKIQLEGVLRGRDIYISGKRYVDELESGT